MPETVLVTGAFGLVGSTTVKLLSDAGRHVVATDLGVPANRKAAGQLSGVDVRFGWQCTAFTARNDGVIAEIEEIETGKRVTVQALYIVGCDGARGIVRRQLGVKYGGDSVDPARPAYPLGGRGCGGLRTCIHVRIASSTLRKPGR